MNNPLISIIIPCYNQAQYLDECLQSVLDQSYTNWECLIINDGSSDNTKEKAEKWIAQNDRFKYFYQENKGVSRTRNFGLENAKGAFIQFLDSDDIIDPDKIQLSLKSLLINNYDLIITNFKTFSIDTKLAQEHPGFLKSDYLNFKGILYQWGVSFNIPIHCGLFSINLFDDFKFSNELKGNEDWMMWLCFFKKKPLVHFIDNPLVYYRSHKESATRNLVVMNDSYIKAITHIRNILSEQEYIHFLIYLVSEKNKTISKLEQKINNYQQSTGYQILNKIKKNRLSKMGIKFVLKLIKKQ